MCKGQYENVGRVDYIRSSDVVRCAYKRDGD
jgi:hypothetical protein